MAILNNGINGGFSGKVGSVVGYTWKGKSVMRGVPKKRTVELSFLQKQQHAKFALMHSFLSDMKDTVNVSFATVAVQMTGYNKAFSYNVKNAIAGVYPDLHIAYPMVLIGRGDLPGLQEVNIHSPAEGVFEINWTNNSGTGRAAATDTLYYGVYGENTRGWTSELTSSKRGDGKHRIENPQWKGQTFHIYVGMISADRKENSDSLYTGVHNIL